MMLFLDSGRTPHLYQGFRLRQLYSDASGPFYHEDGALPEDQSILQDFTLTRCTVLNDKVIHDVCQEIRGYPILKTKRGKKKKGKTHKAHIA